MASRSPMTLHAHIRERYVWNWRASRFDETHILDFHPCTLGLAPDGSGWLRDGFKMCSQSLQHSSRCVQYRLKMLSMWLEMAS